MQAVVMAVLTYNPKKSQPTTYFGTAIPHALYREVLHRTLLEDRLIEAVTLEQLGLEQDLDPRTVQRRVRAAVEKLRLAESELP